MEKEYTVREVMEITIETLRKIRVPVELIGEIGAPISTAVKNLELCLATMEKAEAEQQQKQAEQEELQKLAEQEQLEADPEDYFGEGGEANDQRADV